MTCECSLESCLKWHSLRHSRTFPASCSPHPSVPIRGRPSTLEPNCVASAALQRVSTRHRTQCSSARCSCSARQALPGDRQRGAAPRTTRPPHGQQQRPGAAWQVGQQQLSRAVPVGRQWWAAASPACPPAAVRMLRRAWAAPAWRPARLAVPQPGAPARAWAPGRVRRGQGPPAPLLQQSLPCPPSHSPHASSPRVCAAGTRARSSCGGRHRDIEQRA